MSWKTISLVKGPGPCQVPGEIGGRVHGFLLCGDVPIQKSTVDQGEVLEFWTPTTGLQPFCLKVRAQSGMRIHMSLFQHGGPPFLKLFRGPLV